VVFAVLPVLFMVWLSGSARSSEGLPSVLGEIGGYDAQSRALTLATGSGKVRLVLAPGVPVWQGARSLEADELKTLLGLTAKVRFSQTTDGRIARFVTVARAAPDGHASLASR
jgi:hypothetical protein